MIQILDGPVGTELTRRGVSTRLPMWSAAANRDAPEVVAAIHADYAAAGATVHTANTFRTTARAMGPEWARWAREAVRIARGAVPPEHRIAGSVAPLEDCYRPDLSPGGGAAVEREHRALAGVLADAGVDVLLCETFPNVEEALAAVRAARSTGIETWLALTAGYEANLLTPEALAEGARRAVDLGVAAVLVSCTPTEATLRYVEALRSAGVPFGAYANGGIASAPATPEGYAARAVAWADAGATLLGGCCGTGPEHVDALTRAFGRVAER